MTTRKLPSEWEENPSKRRRVLDINDESNATAASFDILPSDCKVNIFSYLPTEDMNSAAICSKGCCEARNNESLDQARTGTIVLTQNSSPESFNNVVAGAEQNDVFSGNCTCLKIEGVERLPWEYGVVTFSLLTGVTKLQISPASSSNENATASVGCLRALIRMCPNVTDIALNNIKVPREHGTLNITTKYVRRLEWKGCNGLTLTGGEYSGSEATLSELYLDDSEFDCYCGSEGGMRSYGSTGPHTFCLFGSLPNLERVSIKGATVCFNDWKSDISREPLPQEYIMKFVRHCLTLRWLRSDLSEENVAMLQLERPEVTFVSE